MKEIINHAKKMIFENKITGMNCIKFQIHNLDNEMLEKHRNLMILKLLWEA